MDMGWVDPWVGLGWVTKTGTMSTCAPDDTTTSSDVDFPTENTRKCVGGRPAGYAPQTPYSWTIFCHGKEIKEGIRDGRIGDGEKGEGELEEWEAG